MNTLSLCKAEFVLGCNSIRFHRTGLLAHEQIIANESIGDAAETHNRQNRPIEVSTRPLRWVRFWTMQCTTRPKNACGASINPDSGGIAVNSEALHAGQHVLLVLEPRTLDHS